MRFDEHYEKIFEDLLERGIVKTKSEAMRNALNEYGEKYGSVGKLYGLTLHPAGKEDLWDLLESIEIKGSDLLESIEIKGSDKDLSSRVDEVVYGI